MLIIVEGSDCSGKSTLIEAMSKEFDMQVLQGSSFSHAQCSRGQLYHKFNEMTKLDNIILDRYIYSNEVYATLYEDFAILTDEQRRKIESEIKDKALVIYLYADVETLIERINNRGDEYVKAERLPYILEEYEKSMSKVEHLEVVRFDTSIMSTSEVLEVIKMKLM